jgi:hypothetical protein
MKVGMVVSRLCRQLSCDRNLDWFVVLSDFRVFGQILIVFPYDEKALFDHSTKRPIQRHKRLIFARRSFQSSNQRSVKLSNLLIFSLSDHCKFDLTQTGFSATLLNVALLPSGMLPEQLLLQVLTSQFVRVHQNRVMRHSFSANTVRLNMNDGSNRSERFTFSIAGRSTGQSSLSVSQLILFCASMIGSPLHSPFLARHSSGGQCQMQECHINSDDYRLAIQEHREHVNENV